MSLSKLSLITKLSALFSGLLYLFVNVNVLTPDLQGYYFLFQSLSGIQILFELGISQLLISKFAIISSYKNPSPDHGQPTDNLSPTSLLKASIYYYRLISILFFIVATIAGAVYLYTYSRLPLSKWMLPLIFTVLFTSLNLYSSCKLSFMEGMGHLRNVYLIRITSYIAAPIVFFLVCLIRPSIECLAIPPLISLVCTYLYLYNSPKGLVYRDARLLSLGVSGLSLLTLWSKHIFPLHARFAFSWLSGYFISQLYVPVVFSRYGAVDAGKVGLALSALNTVSQLGLSVVVVHSYSLSRLFAHSRFSDMRILFKEQLIKAVSITAFLLILFNIMFSNISPLEQFSSRLPSLNILLLMSITAFVSTTSSAMAIYLRSNGKEPLLGLSLLSALLVFLSVVLGALISLQSIFLFVAISSILSLFYLLHKFSAPIFSASYEYFL